MIHTASFTQSSETSQQLQHCPKQHCQSSYNGHNLTVFKHIILSGHHIDVNGVTILDIEKNWFECAVNESVWVRTKNPPLNCNDGTRNMLSHSSDRSMKRSMQLFSISEKFRK